MNLKERFKVINDELKRHFVQIDNVIEDIENWMPLSDKDFEDKIKISEIDSFIFRYSKIQDKIGTKFFPLVLEVLGEYDEQLAFIDILNKLEKLGLIESAEVWFEYSELRNQLTHEYPNEIDDIKQELEKAVIYYDKIKNTYFKIAEKILHYL